MKGSIKKIKNGKWEIVFDAGTDPFTGKRKQIRRRFNSKPEAVEGMTLLKAEIIKDEFLESSSMTVEIFMDEWFKERIFQLQNSTYDIQKMYYRIVIKPRIGKLKLQNLSNIILQRFVNDLVSEQKYSESTIHLIVRIISSALKKAKRINLIKDNPSIGLTLPKIPRKPFNVWTLDEVNFFLNAAPNVPRLTRCYIGFQLGLLMGLRQGEILGLRFSDIDFNNAVLYVRQTVTQKGLIKPGAKNVSSIRSISIPKILLEELKLHKGLIDWEKGRRKGEYQDNDLVLPTRDGKPMIPRNFRKEFYKLVDTLGLPPIRFHDTRHTHATMLIQQNIHVKLISERLGHADIQTTLNTYSHVLPNMQKEVSNQIDKIINM